MKQRKRLVRVLAMMCSICIILSSGVFAAAQPRSFSTQTYAVEGTSTIKTNFQDMVLYPGSSAGYGQVSCSCGFANWSSGGSVSHSHSTSATRTVNCLTYKDAWCVTKATGTAYFYTY